MLPICGRFKYCKKNRNARAVERARTILEKEINIIDIIRANRFFYMAMWHLLSRAKQEEFLERSRYVKIDPDASGSDDVQDSSVRPKLK